MAVMIGDEAPLFSLPDQDGKMFDLGSMIGKKVMVVYFYPKDETPGCTKEACYFRDRYEDFVSLGADVVGISSDPQRSHQEFATKHNLPFRILSDVDEKVREMYGATGLLGPGRVTYVIDKKGVVRHIFSSQMQATKHIDEAFAMVEKLAKG
ncbi:MAG: putative peroxiredoxin [Methanomassiliicoccales archaeon PtaU1.Bin124]|nr:MAG: putative peroxiredoxin [Methanomassiliicoccales archaeon PtaU1.Bin124]